MPKLNFSSKILGICSKKQVFYSLSKEFEAKFPVTKIKYKLKRRKTKIFFFSKTFELPSLILKIWTLKTHGKLVWIYNKGFSMLDVVVNSEKLMLFPLFKKTLTKPLVPTKSTTIHNKTLNREIKKKEIIKTEYIHKSRTKI